MSFVDKCFGFFFGFWLFCYFVCLLALLFLYFKNYISSPGMASSTERRILFWNGCSGGLPPNETTFARVLHEQGYSTALVGMRHRNLISNVIQMRLFL